MPLFPSEAWCSEAAMRADQDPESEQAARGWKGDVGLVIDREEGLLEKPFTVYCNPVNGKLGRLRFPSDPDDLEELEPAYLIRAPYSLWKGLLQGAVDPVEAVLRRRVEVRGDLQPILERLRYRTILDRLVSALETRYIDD